MKRESPVVNYSNLNSVKAFLNNVPIGKILKKRQLWWISKIICPHLKVYGNGDNIKLLKEIFKFDLHINHSDYIINIVRF